MLKLTKVGLLALLGLVLFGTTASSAQEPESDRIRVFVFCAEEAPENAIVDPNLPPGEWQVEPLRWGPESNSYYYDIEQAHDRVEQLSRQLQRTGSRREMMELVESRDDADLFLEIVATEVTGAIQGGGIFEGSVTTTARQDVLIARMSIRYSDFTSDFLGTKLDLLRTPAFTAAAQIEEFVRSNLDTLRQALPR